jgi:xanthine dehydrogenase accessory factor
MLSKFLEKTQELSRKNEPFALAVVVRREEPSSGKVGDKAVINKFGEIIGWVGGGCVRAILIKEAEDAMKTGQARLVRIGKNTGTVNAKGTIEYKMTCQSEGTVEVFIEPVLPAPLLVVVGKSAIARALVKMAKAAGYRVTAMANDARIDTFESPDQLITQLSFAQAKTDPATSIVVATQGEQDEKALELAMQQQYAYLGFVASHKKKESVLQYLRDAGMAAGKVDGIDSPAGIDINAKRPEEVAISILAAMIRRRNNLPSDFHFTRFDEIPAEAGKPSFYINPVCGVPVDINNPKHVVDYQGENVYFCCDGCHTKFLAEPEKYMKANGNAKA